MLRGVVTQNIDGLHQLAGSTEVLELHGTARDVACVRCGDRQPAEMSVQKFISTNQVPSCEQCGAPLKHATVSFGQSLPPDVVSTAMQWMRQAELVFSIGSSLVVHPAASLPRLAVDEGARLVIINRDPTPLDSIASLVLSESIGNALTKINDGLT